MTGANDSNGARLLLLPSRMWLTPTRWDADYPAHYLPQTRGGVREESITLSCRRRRYLSTSFHFFKISKLFLTRYSSVSRAVSMRLASGGKIISPSRHTSHPIIIMGPGQSVSISIAVLHTTGIFTFTQKRINLGALNRILLFAPCRKVNNKNSH